MSQRISDGELNRKLIEFMSDGKSPKTIINIIYQWVKMNRIDAAQMQDACSRIDKND